MTFLSTYFALGKSLKPSTYEKFPDNAKKTIDLVSRLNNGLSCMPIDPNLMCLTDDTTLYVFEGIEQKKASWSVVNVDSLKNEGVHSRCKLNENYEVLQGMRIIMTGTYGASGIAEPICINVSSLDENELIIPDEKLSASKGIFVLKV